MLQVDADHFVGVTDWTGRAAPLHATANGKALLAFGGEQLSGRLSKLTTHTIVDRSDLRAELTRARNAGFAVAVEELEVGLNAVAAPVFDASGSCIAVETDTAAMQEPDASKTDAATALSPTSSSSTATAKPALRARVSWAPAGRCSQR